METATLTQTLSTQDQAERDLRDALVRAWRANPKQGASAHAAYAMIRGKSLIKTFSPITRPSKLSNGHGAHSGRDSAIWSAKQGTREAWGWAWDILIEAGATLDRYGRIEITSLPLLAQWKEKAANELDTWR